MTSPVSNALPFASTQQSSSDRLSTLPSKLLVCISRFLGNPKDNLSMSLTNRTIQAAINDEIPPECLPIWGKASIIPDTRTRDERLKDLSFEWVEAGKDSLAVQVANTVNGVLDWAVGPGMTDEYLVNRAKDAVFTKISIRLFKKLENQPMEQVDKLVLIGRIHKFVLNIREQEDKEQLLAAVSQEYAKAGRIDLANRVANTISHPIYGTLALNAIQRFTKR
jgi:hypothetical protein